MSQEPKPPFVTFESRPMEDRNASLEAGHYVAKDVNFALITPSGSRDRMEKVAEDWLKDLEEAVRQERFPASWLDQYRQLYKAWQNNQELPETGHPVKEWPVASPSQVRMLIDMGLTTVEHVAEMNEEAVTRIGMGGRALKSKAEEWLKASADVGKVSGEIDSLKKVNEALLSRAEAAEINTKNLAKELEDLKALMAKK